MNADELLGTLRDRNRARMQVATANRNKAQRTISGEYAGLDGSTGEAIFELPNGETIRTQAINTGYTMPGQTAPIRLAKGGSAVSDGRHSGG